MQSTYTARLTEAVGHCRYSDKHVLSQGKGERYKNRHAHWSVSHGEMKSDTKLTEGWQPCLSFTGWSTCVAQISVPKVDMGWLTQRVPRSTGIPPAFELAFRLRLLSSRHKLWSNVWTLVIMKQHIADIIKDNLGSFCAGTHNPKMLRTTGWANFARAGHKNTSPLLSQ